jgi:uncharacterized membrane protein (UPF0127 family)
MRTRYLKAGGSNTRRLRSLLVASLLVALGSPAAVSQGITFVQAPLTLITESGRHDFNVDVAQYSSQSDLGLRYRHSVAPDGGLLILLSAAAPSQIEVSTEGVSLPLDLLFIASDGTVREVHPWIPTDSSTPIQSNGPVAAALELAGGTITRYGILPGDRVLGMGLGESQ